MKTPHRITLIRGKNIHGKYNPNTDSYEKGVENRKTVPCLINFIRQAKVFEEYGNRNEVVMICRFQQEQTPFYQAEYKGFLYEPLESIDAPIKGAVRLKRVSGRNEARH